MQIGFDLLGYSTKIQFNKFINFIKLLEKYIVRKHCLFFIERCLYACIYTLCLYCATLYCSEI